MNVVWVNGKVSYANAVFFYNPEGSNMKHVTLKRPIALVSDLNIQTNDPSSVTHFIRVRHIATLFVRGLPDRFHTA